MQMACVTKRRFPDGFKRDAVALCDDRSHIDRSGCRIVDYAEDDASLQFAGSLLTPTPLGCLKRST